jgi:hypothetical protein
MPPYDKPGWKWKICQIARAHTVKFEHQISRVPQPSTSDPMHEYDMFHNGSSKSLNQEKDHSITAVKMSPSKEYLSSIL